MHSTANSKTKPNYKYTEKRKKLIKLKNKKIKANKPIIFIKYFHSLFVYFFVLMYFPPKALYRFTFFFFNLM